MKKKRLLIDADMVAFWLISAEGVAAGVTMTVGDGVIRTVGVGVATGVIVVVGIGRYFEARTPMRIPRRIRATTIKKVLRKPDFLGGWTG